MPADEGFRPLPLRVSAYERMVVLLLSRRHRSWMALHDAPSVLLDTAKTRFEISFQPAKTTDVHTNKQSGREKAA
jgi:putative SOS response-associated peptidase YedK